MIMLMSLLITILFKVKVDNFLFDKARKIWKELIIDNSEVLSFAILMLGTLPK